MKPFDPYGYDQVSRMDRAFVRCLLDGVHPGPKELGIRLYGSPRRSLTGVVVQRRLELMQLFGVEYQRGYYKGTVPITGTVHMNMVRSLKAEDFLLLRDRTGVPT